LAPEKARQMDGLNQTIMKKHTYLNKAIERPADLAPKGIRSTYQTEKLPFNETFERLWKVKK
jgi:hypothetical protein